MTASFSLLSETSRHTLRLNAVDLHHCSRDFLRLRSGRLRSASFVQHFSRDFGGNLAAMLQKVTDGVFRVPPQRGNIGLIPAAFSHVGRESTKISKAPVHFIRHP